MEEYLKILLEQIRCKKARPYIRQELQEHIEDQIEANVCAGMERERAEQEAVRDMGDPIEAGLSLDRVHKPQVAWKFLFIITLISIVGIIVHLVICGNTENAGAVSSRKYIYHVAIGLAVMMIIYFFDYTLIAEFSKIIAAVMLAVCIVTTVSGHSVNGMRSYLGIGRISVSVAALMLFYVPVYAGILYQYRGSGYKGLIKAIVYMILPVFFVFKMPATMHAALILISMLVLLTIALLKDWFLVAKQKTICVLWGSFVGLPLAALLGLYFGQFLPKYQLERIQSVVARAEENGSMSALHSILQANKWFGNSGLEIAETLPEYNTDYILTYLSSTYGMAAVFLLCSVLTVLFISIFHVAVRQKNQLGMIMGSGSGMVLSASFLINMLENLRLLPRTATFLPFFSAGGSYIVVSYALLGIVLNIYRYKSVYPQQLKIRHRTIKMTIGS